MVLKHAHCNRELDFGSVWRPLQKISWVNKVTNNQRESTEKVYYRRFATYASSGWDMHYARIDRKEYRESKWCYVNRLWSESNCLMYRLFCNHNSSQLFFHIFVIRTSYAYRYIKFVKYICGCACVYVCIYKSYLTK